MEQVIAKEGVYLVDQFLSYGPLGLVALMFVLDKFGWLNIHRTETKNKITAINDKMNKMGVELHEIHEWQKAEDDNGMKKIYYPKSMETTLLKLDSTLERQGNLMQQLVYEIKDTNREVKSLKDRTGV